MKAKGVSNTKIGKKFGVTRDTVARFLKHYNI
jgi:transposase